MSATIDKTARGYARVIVEVSRNEHPDADETTYAVRGDGIDETDFVELREAVQCWVESGTEASHLYAVAVLTAKGCEDRHYRSRYCDGTWLKWEGCK